MRYSKTGKEKLANLKGGDRGWERKIMDKTKNDIKIYRSKRQQKPFDDIISSHRSIDLVRVDHQLRYKSIIYYVIIMRESVMVHLRFPQRGAKI